MSIKQLWSPQGLLDSRSSPGIGQPHLGHAHFWERAMSRRQFIQTVAGATGAILGSRLWMPALAWADEPSDPNDPKPIPGGFQPPIPGAPFIHVFLPGHGNEPSTITDFKGAVGLANIAGTGTGTNTKTGEKTSLLFDVDMRFMKGTFIALNGRRHRGTFGFI
jgi:hypothetical protein